MFDLFEAIYAHFLIDPLANSLTGLYNTEAPQDAVFPYGTFSLISDVPDWTFTEDFENCLIQFNLFSKTSDPQEICNLYELLKGDTALGTGFDFLELSLNNYETVLLQRENALLTKIEDVWQYNVTYRILLQKTGEVAHFVSRKFLYNLLSI